jgi:hypothetical protein
MLSLPQNLIKISTTHIRLYLNSVFLTTTLLFRPLIPAKILLRHGYTIHTKKSVFANFISLKLPKIDLIVSCYTHAYTWFPLVDKGVECKFTVVK